MAPSESPTSALTPAAPIEPEVAGAGTDENAALSTTPDVETSDGADASPHPVEGFRSWADEYFGDGATNSATHSESATPPAEQSADDWFADDVVEARASHAEPVRPTPAFNDLSGLERLATSTAPVGASENPSPLDGPPELPNAEAVGPVSAPSPAGAPAFEHDPRVDVADLLEHIALRVREGDVALPPDLPTSSDTAVLAAVLAALLRTPAR